LRACSDIRRAQVSDAEACAQVVLGWVAATPWIADRFTEAEMTTMFAEAIPERDVFVIGEPVVGYLSFHSDISLIAGLYVTRQGEGLGKRLVDYIKSDRNYLQLWTHAPNTRAHVFYKREGFAWTEDTRDGEDGPSEFRMEWHR